MDAEGQHLQELWQKVRINEGELLSKSPVLLTFVTALRQTCELKRSAVSATTRSSDSASNGVMGEAEPPYSRTPVVDTGQVAPRRGAKTPMIEPAVEEVVPTLTRDARGIPAAVVRGLVEVVFSVSVCLCGQKVAVGSSPERQGCPIHGLTAISWTRVLPSGTWRDGMEAISGGNIDFKRSRDDGGVAAIGEGTESGTYKDPGGDQPIISELAQRRELLIETLRALSAACRWSHTREELARQCRGGTAKGLSLLLDALCARLTELKQRYQGPSRRSTMSAKANVKW